jgi:hypothetical protein
MDAVLLGFESKKSQWRNLVLSLPLVEFDDLEKKEVEMKKTAFNSLSCIKSVIESTIWS